LTGTNEEQGVLLTSKFPCDNIDLATVHGVVFDNIVRAGQPARRAQHSHLIHPGSRSMRAFKEEGLG
jgi:hypothetical protein